MKKFLKKISIAILAVIILTSGAMASYATNYKHCDRASAVTPEIYWRVIEVLRAHQDPATAGVLFDTGIVCSKEDFDVMDRALTHLFMGNKKVVIECNNTTVSTLYVQSIEDYDSHNGSITIAYKGKFGEHPQPTIYVGFYPGTDPAELMREQDAAYARMMEILAGAPQTEKEFYEYCGHTINNCANYCETEHAHCAYGTLCEGLGVCEGFSVSMFDLCWLAGRECYYLSNGSHSVNAFPINGRLMISDLTDSEKGAPLYRSAADDEVVQILSSANK